MLDELRLAAARQRANHQLRGLVFGCKRLLTERGETNSMAIARQLIERLDALPDDQMGAFFDYLALQLSPDPQQVLHAAQAYADKPNAQHLIALTRLAEPPRQELLRRLNRTPGGTGTLVRMRRALLHRLPRQPELMALESDMLHLFGSWFNPGFLQMKRVDWNSPAKLLEKIIHHEAVHAIDGWEDLRRRLQPDRRCFAFFHPQLPDEPLIFVEVALLPEMPGAIAPLIDKASTPLPPERFRVAAFYSISNCEPGLRNVSLGNFLIKSVAEQLQRELPRIRSFCTLSPVPGFAAWLLAEPDFAALPNLRRNVAADFEAAREHLRTPVRRRTQRAAACVHPRQAGQGIAGRAADAVLGLPAAPVAHAARRPGRAFPPGQRRTAGAAERAWQHVAQGPEAVLRRHGQLPVRPGQDRSQPREVQTR